MSSTVDGWVDVCRALGPDGGSTVSVVACLGAAREEEDVIFDIHIPAHSLPIGCG